MAELIDTSVMIAPAYQPKQQNKFVIEWEGIDAWTVKNFARPSLTFQEVVVDYLNTKRYFQGKFEWATVQLSMYDPIDPSAAQKVMQWVRLGYENLTGRTGYKEFYVARGFKLKVLDPPGSVIEQWDFINLFPTAVNFGPLDYASGDIMLVEITARFDACVNQF